MARISRDDTGLFFDGFKHFKNNISNLVFYELPLLVDVGASEYLSIKPVNYKSKFPDMKKIGLIEYENTRTFKVSKETKEIYHLIEKHRRNLVDSEENKVTSYSSELYESSFYNSLDYEKISDFLLSLEINYYDEAVSIRPYFVLIKILIKNNITVLDDDILLNILSLNRKKALELKYDPFAFAELPDKLKEKVKRPKSYIYDFIKASKIIDNSKTVTLNKEKFLRIVSLMNEIYFNDNEQNNTNRVRIGQDNFRRDVLKAYNYKCAVTGKSISYLSKYETSRNYVLEAAHIIPYSDGGSFSVSNGIALSPEIHKLYDLGIITFAYNNKGELICIAKNENGIDGGEYLEQLNGKVLQMPNDNAYYPDPQAIKYKYENYYLNYNKSLIIGA